MAMVISILPMSLVYADTSRITINNLYARTVNDRPEVDADVTRLTNNNITVTASVENVSDSQIPDIFYEITNLNTNITTVEKSNKAQKTSAYDISFKNVALTEGLNKITIKLGNTSVVSSSPGWVYFTPTTNIGDLKINGAPFIDTQFYPENPTQGSTVNITGLAPNASEVQAYVLGDPTPKSSYLNNGTFFFNADDINKVNSIANFKLKPGDNPLTITAKNNTKTYTVDKNLIYDNGNPFAFEATIKDGTTTVAKKLVTTPIVTTSNVEVSALLKNDLTSFGDLKYRYVDVMIAGKRFGPYDLKSAAPATRALAFYPSIINAEHSDTTVTLVGTGLNASDLFITVQDKDGTAVAALASLPRTTVGSVNVLNSDNSIALFNIPAGSLTTTGAPYKFIVQKGPVATADTLETFNIQVVDTTPSSDPALPQVTTFPTISLNEGYAANTKTVVFGTAVVPNQTRIDVTDLTGQNVLATALGTGTVATTNFTFNMPLGLIEGQYKMRVSYNNNVLTEQFFTIGVANPVAPTVASPVTPVNLPRIPAKTYVTVTGANLGTLKGDITAATITKGATSTGLTVYDVNPNSIIFEVATPAVLTDNVYDIQFSKQVRYANGSAFGSPVVVTVPNAIKSVAPAVTHVATAMITAVTPDQLLTTELTTTPITLTGGAGITDQTKVQIEVLKEDGSIAGPIAQIVGIDVTTPATPQVTAKLPTLTEGNYTLRISYNGQVVTQYPMSVVNPRMSSISPAVKSITDPTTTFDITGSSLGHKETALQLKFTSDSNLTATPVFQAVTTSSLEAGSRVKFAIPSLTEDTYSVTLLYNNEVMGSPLKYTVSSPQASLIENAAKSKLGRYKVFEFKTNITIPSDRFQTVQFKFYNFASDVVPPTTFAFSYEDPSLPYINSVERSKGVQLSELSQNEINEVPTKLKVYGNSKTNKINVYFGEYTNNAVPNQTVTSTGIDTDGRKYFEITIDDLVDGQTKMTIIPSSAASISPVKGGENFSGKKTYDLLISSTPYVIVNNLFSGLVVKDQNSEITCRLDNGTVLPRCFSGRLVNVPQLSSLALKVHNVDIYINGSKTALAPANILSGGRFYYQMSGSNVLVEGKNTIKVVINIGTKQITESIYEVFVFSTDKPEFLSVKPIETTDVIKYTPGKNPDTYATNETTVRFSGQFANASEIKLTVRQKDADGKSIVRYDRRYNNFTSYDPAVSNPSFWSTVNSPAGQFTTNFMTLSTKGDTIFEFAITNSSNITVTRTITVTREPLPYLILYPLLTKVVKGGKTEFHANINSNYVEIEMEAENADKVLFGKEDAIAREVTDIYGIKRTRYYYEAAGLKVGRNDVKFTVIRGTEKTNGSIVINNADTPIEGAQYKTALKNNIKVFDGQVSLTFPKGTNFMRNEAGAVNQFLTSDRQLLFGIANNDDGRVDKYKHPAASDGQINNPNPIISSEAKFLLSEPTGRFRPAGDMIWIDAGTIQKNESDRNKALRGSGRLPYDSETFYNRNLADLVVPTERGTLKLKYDSNVRDDAWRYLTVYQFDIYEDYRGVTQPRWRNIGGVVDPKTNTITVPLEHFGYYQVMFMDQSYDDVIGHPWARNDLDNLYSKGILVNKESSALVPNDPISRGEFSTILVKIFDIPIQYTESPSFTDVLRVNPLTNGLYDYKYIESAARAGIIRGSGGGRFNPDGSITRQDAAVMIARAADMKLNADLDKSLVSLQKAFTDANGIDIYARASIEAVNKTKFITGRENTLLQGQAKPTYRFDPLETFTRAEAARVVMNVLKQQKKIPK